MPRAIWSGSISFGLLNVPVKLYSAVSKQQVRFKELREDDGSRIRHKRVAEADGEEVPYEKIIKGYEFAPDQFVKLTKDELAELEPQKTRAIEIKDFVDLDEIDPIYFETPYYLGPDKGAEKAYALLVEAMREEGKVAIARFVLRNKENLAAIRPMGDVLTMATMRFHDEVTDPADLDEVFGEKPGKPDEREVEMAQQLIASLAGDFDPKKYRDEYREELTDLLERKAAGEEVVAAPTEDVKPTKAPDLMAALEESLASVKAESKGNGGDAKPKKRKAPAKASKTSSKSSAKSSSKKKPAAKRKTKAKAGSKKGTEVTVGGRRVKLTNLDKVLYPSTGTTKAEVIDYYARVGDAIIPHLKGRPLTLRRFPEGVGEQAKSFFEKNCPKHRPDWVKTTPIWVDRRAGEIDFCLCENLPTLTWMAQLAALELDPSLSKGKAMEQPTVLAFDLDPGAPAALADCCKVALRLRELFGNFDLECLPKVSGGKGLQVYVPLNTKVTYEQTSPFAKAVAQLLEKETPKDVVSKMAKKERKGKVFVDWSQNHQKKTTIAVYSLRARERPTVSMPLDWSEVESAAKRKRDAEKLRFEIGAAAKRVDDEGDLFEPVLKLKQKLPKLEALA